jgi:hypothetical protein
MTRRRKTASEFHTYYREPDKTAHSSNQAQLSPSPSLPLLELSKATFSFEICALMAITYALWLASVVETSQNMIFCSYSQCSLRSSILSLRSSSYNNNTTQAFYSQASWVG